MVKIKSRAAKIAPVMRQDFLKTIKAEMTGEINAATEEMWMQGGGIQIPCKYKFYGDDSYKNIVRNLLKKYKSF